MRLNLQTDFGFRVLMLLGNRPDEWVTIAEMARILGVRPNHLQKVVRHLLAMQWVEAKRGPAGGVHFVPATRQVTVGEVLRGLENSLDLVECFQPAGRHCPLTGVCRLAPLLHRAREAFFRELDTTTLGELLVSPRDSAAFLGVQINTQFSP